MPLHLHRQGAREMLDATLGSLSIGRLGAIAGVALPIAIAHPITHFFAALDDVLYPEWRSQPTDRPVFIYANPRSGTTFLHRLMSLDSERFATISIYQMIVASVSYHRFWRRVGELDARTFGLGRRLLDAVNARWFQTWKDGIHEMGFDKPEEDEGTWVYCLHSVTFILVCPFLTKLPSLVWFDQLPAPVRHRFMDYYEEVMKRLLHAEGGQKQFLNKNVHFAPRVHSVYERFPDGIYIYLIRHPYEALPSFLSMWHAKWATHSPDIGVDHPESNALAEMAIAYLRYGLASREVIPDENFMLLRYDDLVAHPQATVEAIYEKFGMEVSDAFRAHLVKATSRQRHHESSHEYSLEQYGLTKRWVYERLEDVFEEFGFDPQLDD